jgi:hypothetical protein
MISLPTGTNIWIAAGVTDMRRGFTGSQRSTRAKVSNSIAPRWPTGWVARAGRCGLWWMR